MPRQLTPREEFESEFGFIIDEQWQWLKEFCLRHPVTGHGTGGDVDFFNGNKWTIEEQPERVIEHSDVRNVSLDREPNVFGFPLLRGERFKLDSDAESNTVHIVDAHGNVLKTLKDPEGEDKWVEWDVEADRPAPERSERRRWSEEWLRAVIREEIAAAIKSDIRPPRGV